MSEMLDKFMQNLILSIYISKVFTKKMVKTMVNKERSEDEIHPQVLNASVTTPSTGAWTTAEIAVPVSPFGARKGQAQVMEILKIWFYPQSRASDGQTLECFLMTRNLSTKPYADDPAVLGGMIEESEFVTSGAMQVRYPIELDMTDSGGNGMLVAVPKLYLGGDNDADNVAKRFSVKILYRFRHVGALEFAGISQSQVAGN